MAKYDALGALPGGDPGPWGEPVTIKYDQRDAVSYTHLTLPTNREV